MIFVLYLGLSCILVGMPRYQKITGLEDKFKRFYFISGWLLILVTVTLLVLEEGIVMGLLQLSVFMSLCSTFIIFTFSYAPKCLIVPVVFFLPKSTNRINFNHEKTK